MEHVYRSAQRERREISQKLRRLPEENSFIATLTKATYDVGVCFFGEQKMSGIFLLNTFDVVNLLQKEEEKIAMITNSPSSAIWKIWNWSCANCALCIARSLIMEKCVSRLFSATPSKYYFYADSN